MFPESTANSHAFGLRAPTHASNMEQKIALLLDRTAEKARAQKAAVAKQMAQRGCARADADASVEDREAAAAKFQDVNQTDGGIWNGSRAKSIGMEMDAGAAEVTQAPPVHAEKGQRVQVIGLETKPEYNDELGTVISWEAAKQRAGVRLDNGASLSLRPANLSPATIAQTKPTVSPEAAAMRDGATLDSSMEMNAPQRLAIAKGSTRDQA